MTKNELIKQLETEFDQLVDTMKGVNLEAHPELILKKMVLQAKLNVLQTKFTNDKTVISKNKCFQWLPVKTHKPPLNKVILVYSKQYYNRPFEAKWDGKFWYDLVDEAFVKMSDMYNPTHWINIKLPNAGE